MAADPAEATSCSAAALDPTGTAEHPGPSLIACEPLRPGRQPPPWQPSGAATQRKARPLSRRGQAALQPLVGQGLSERSLRRCRQTAALAMRQTAARTRQRIAEPAICCSDAARAHQQRRGGEACQANQEGMRTLKPFRVLRITGQSTLVSRQRGSSVKSWRVPSVPSSVRSAVTSF